MKRKMSENSLMTQIIAVAAKTLPTLLIAVLACLVVVPSVQADILVANHTTGYIELYSDDGTLKNSMFIQGVTAAEGLQCVKLSSNEIYVANSRNNYVGVYYLSGPMAGMPVPGAGFYISNPTHPGGGMASIALDPTGTILYAADNTNNYIWAVDLPSGGGTTCPPTNACQVSTAASHDIIIGPGGKVYATNLLYNPPIYQPTDVLEFDAYHPGVRWNASAQLFIKKGTYNGHSLNSPAGMVFDNAGNFWVTNSDLNGHDSDDAIFEFTGAPNPGVFRNFTPDTGGLPLGMDISPVNPPSPPFDSCKGCIVVANYVAGTVSQIDPNNNCNGGTCTLEPFFSTGPNPKYVNFTENCRDSGYVEICKMSCLTNPVTGNFTFSATNSGDTISPITVPVNACSGAIQIPNGTVTINEVQQLGDEVANITAFNYDYQGYQINALLSYNYPFQTGNVDVVSGDVSTETVVGFTNCASGPGELKICKVAGQGVMIGTLFYFTASGDPTVYPVPAGPAPAGYCVVGKSYPVGTPVLVTERPKIGTVVSSITVAPPDRGGTQTSNSVIAIIDSGTTEVTFTNTANGGLGCPTCRVH